MAIIQRPAVTGFEYTAGVGAISGATLPPIGIIRSNTPATVAGNSSTTGATGTHTNAPANSNGYSGPYSDKSFLSQPFAVWLGLIVLLFVAKFLGEHDSIPFTPANIKISGYNLIAVGTTASVFIVLFKVLVNRFPVPGLTEFGNAL